MENTIIEEPKNFCDKNCGLFWSTLYIEKKISQFILFKENGIWKILVQSNVGCCNDKVFHDTITLDLTKEEEPTNDNNFFCEIIDGKITIYDCENVSDSLINKIDTALKNGIDKSKEVEYLKEHCKYFLEVVAEELINLE